MPTVPVKSPPARAEQLLIPQARALIAAMPEDPTAHWTEWPSYNRYDLSVACGFNPTTGTLNRVLNGIREGSSSGNPHRGLIERGLLKASALSLDGGAFETHYRITAAGIREIQRYLDEHGPLPETRDPKACTNDRYEKRQRGKAVPA